MLQNRGNVCIIVNVASKWGKTKVNYTQLVALHEKYGDSKVKLTKNVTKDKILLISGVIMYRVWRFLVSLVIR